MNSVLQEYTPDERRPWNLRRVVHLHRRAGFAATWHELQRDLSDGPQAAIERLLTGRAYTTGVPEAFEETSRLLCDAAVASGSIHRLKAWWIYRMLFSPDPLGERLTLIWHNHFATSNRKVEDVSLMRRQNDLLRQFARAPFGELLTHAVKDPALLVWLDADTNRREHPNENLARELLELFSLGVGNYSETDVKEAARALTGWTVKNRQFRDVADYHDDGEKTILGSSGRWRGDDLVRLLLEQPATSRRLARRVCEMLLGEGTTGEEMIETLAVGLRERNLDVAWAVGTVLRSNEFFDDANIGNRVLGPAQFVVGAVRALEMFDPPPSTIVLAEWMAALGQDLFEPPNVFGWPGGRAWLNTRSLIARGNFATRLADGGLQSAAAPRDWMSLARRHGCESQEQFGRLLQQLLWNAVDNESGEADDARQLVAAVLGSPRAQLG
ncbi:MAG TPA: DUF1800 domain-containing protein [Pirellulales bacterium]|nr:DUF1800 domain-containing protein [Pirellulales bacterium]